MKILILISSATILLSQNIWLKDINITSSPVSNSKPVLSVNLASTLTQNHPSISMIRRAATSNNIIIRGMDNDNINVIVNGTKTYGACPNKMDPPISHVDTNDIKSIKIIEGPYDVENFNTLSGLVKIKMRQPKKGLHGNINTNYGSYDYKNLGINISGGNSIVKLLVNGQITSSNQYKDGQGNTLAQQTKNKAPLKNQYKNQYFSKQAYKRKNFVIKTFINITTNQKLKLSYTASKNNDILYPSTAMDGIFDNSNLYNIKYNIKGIGAFSKKLQLQYYQSNVNHLMSNQYRKSPTLKTNHLKSKMQGIELKNQFDISGYKLTVGLKSSKRYWNGAFSMNNIFKIEDIPNVSTYNNGIFIKLHKKIGRFSYTVGSNYIISTIKSPSYTTKKFNSLNGYILTDYKLNPHNKLIFGIGKSSRLPDAKELYFKLPTGMIGNKNLNQVSNYETDISLYSSYDNFLIKTKIFYSKIKNYIIYNAQVNTNNYQNIDASIYGFSINSSYFITNKLALKIGSAYQRGVKDTFATNQHDKNLPNITPLKVDTSLTYTYSHNSYIQAKIVAYKAWNKYDSDDGEQKIGGWSILNLKTSHKFNKHLIFVAGIKNLFNKTYIMSNTYKALALLSGGNNIMLLNEPGRYFYINLTIRY